MTSPWYLFNRAQEACCAGRLDELKECIAEGFDVNYMGPVFGTTTIKKSVLGIACARRDFEIVKYLISVDAKINFDDGYSFAWPLWDACHGGSLEIVEYLIAHGADPEKTGDTGYCSLRIAMHSSNAFGIVRCLLSHGANPNVRFVDGRTILHELTHVHHKNIAKLLIQYGADVNARDNASSTPLEIATSKSIFWLMEVLVENGARLNDECREGRFVLDIAISYHRSELAHRNTRYLIHKGATATSMTVVKRILRHAQNYVLLCDKVNTLDVVRFIGGF